MSRRVHHLCEQAASPHQEISSPLSPAAVATGWVQARRSQGPLRGFCPAGAPEDGRAGRPRPASRFGPRGGSAAGTCGRTRSRPEPAATWGWLSEKGLRAEPGSRRTVQGEHLERGAGRRQTRPPLARPHRSSSVGTRREGSGAGPSGQAVGGGRRGWPRSSLAPRPGGARRVPFRRGQRSGLAAAAPARQQQVCGGGDGHGAGTRSCSSPDIPVRRCRYGRSHAAEPWLRMCWRR